MLVGDKVVLTALRESDRETLFEWINAPQTVRFNAPYKPVHWPSHAGWFDALAGDRSRVVFAIRESCEGAALGMVQLVDIDPVHRSAQLTIRIGEAAARDRGLGGESLRLVIDYAWRDLNLRRVWLTVFADNRRAIAAYRKAGLAVEGCMREAAHVDGKWKDVLIMAVLRERER